MHASIESTNARFAGFACMLTQFPAIMPESRNGPTERSIGIKVGKPFYIEN